MKPRTNQEILEAIQALKNNKIVCEHYDYHGNDNHIAIDVMIEVLEKRLTQKQIQNQYPYYPAKKVYQKALHQKWEAATNARHFMDGIFYISDLLYPEPTNQSTNIYSYITSLVIDAKRLAQKHSFPCLFLMGNTTEGYVNVNASFKAKELIWLINTYIKNDPDLIPILTLAIAENVCEDKEHNTDRQIVEHAKNHRTDN